MIEIRNDVPPPGKSNVEKYGLKKIEVGEHIFIEGQKGSGEAVRTAHSYAQRSGKKFQSRADADGVRIWRVA